MKKYTLDERKFLDLALGVYVSINGSWSGWVRGLSDCIHWLRLSESLCELQSFTVFWLMRCCVERILAKVLGLLKGPLGF